MHIKTRIIRPEPKMRVLPSLSLALLMSVSAVATVAPAAAQAYTSVEFSVGFAPPPLPVYDQPPIPGYGYIWIPGYWSWDDDQGQYYWVDGRWVRPPHAGYLWTPGYWDYDGDQYVFVDGYWGPQVGYYGGINYGYGYGGYGYDGGYWNNDRFYYNRWANNFGGRDFDEVYERRWDNDEHRDRDNDRRSWADRRQGGQGWGQGADHRFDGQNRIDRNGAGQPQQGWVRGNGGVRISPQQGWTGGNNGVVVQPQQGWGRANDHRFDGQNRFDRGGGQPQQGWVRGNGGVAVQPRQGRFSGQQPDPQAHGGYDRSGQHQHDAGVAPTIARPNWGGDRMKSPSYDGPRQTFNAPPQSGFQGRPAPALQPQQQPRQTFAAPQAQRQAPQAQPREEGRRRDDNRQ